ncbi:hypothetical protein [Bradyrhizobium sp. SRS-191]|uniref:hypothetical protein n=1 Tax=Bradyrhizobium sp. SRS-191 TaxID=2962606 RepID=UPI00211E5573|nr:hypothetical protein [Bradyrhizobium sp. SRS-191]
MACVSTVIFCVILVIGAGFFSALLSGFMTFIFISLGIGRLVLEQLALWSVILLIVDRAGLLPISEWVHGIVTVIGRSLT